jgi:hypothetical protein
LQKCKKKIANISNYDKAKALQEKLIKSINKDSSNLLKILIKRSNYYPTIVNGKVKETRDEVLERTDNAYLHIRSIEIFNLPYAESYAATLISGMKLKNGKFSIPESYIKKLPQNIADDVIKILKMDSIKSSLKDEAKTLEIKALDFEKFFEENDSKNESDKEDN